MHNSESLACRDTAAAVSQPAPGQLLLSGRWTATCAGAVGIQLRALRPGAASAAVADARQIEAMDTAGAWLLHALLRRFQDQGATMDLQGMRPEFMPLFAQVGERIAEQRGATDA